MRTNLYIYAAICLALTAAQSLASPSLLTPLGNVRVQMNDTGSYRKVEILRELTCLKRFGNVGTFCHIGVPWTRTTEHLQDASYERFTHFSTSQIFWTATGFILVENPCMNCNKLMGIRKHMTERCSTSTFTWWTFHRKRRSSFTQRTTGNHQAILKLVGFAFEQFHLDSFQSNPSTWNVPVFLPFISIKKNVFLCSKIWN